MISHSTVRLGIGNWNEISIYRQFKNGWYRQFKNLRYIGNSKWRRYIDISIYRQFKSWYIFILESLKFPYTDTVTHTKYIMIIHDDALMKLHKSLDQIAAWQAIRIYGHNLTVYYRPPDQHTEVWSAPPWIEVRLNPNVMCTLRSIQIDPLPTLHPPNPRRVSDDWRFRYCQDAW